MEKGVIAYSENGESYGRLKRASDEREDASDEKQKRTDDSHRTTKTVEFLSFAQNNLALTFENDADTISVIGDEDLWQSVEIGIRQS